MAGERLSRAAYARRRGCDEKAVRKAIAAGRISLVEGKIDPEVADIQWAKNTRPRADTAARAAAARLGPASVEAEGAVAPAQGSGGANAVPRVETYTDATARKASIDADRAKLELERAQGALISRETARAELFAGFRSLRDRVMAAPRRCARDVINVGDVREIELRFETELRRALNLLNDYDRLPPELAAALNGKA